MDFTYLWNKLSLFWEKSIILTLFSIFIGYTSYGQKYQEINLPNSDNHKLHYGFVIGLHVYTPKVKYNQEFVRDTDLLKVQPMKQGGFTLGFLVNKRLGDFFDLRVLPTAAFYDNVLKYHRQTPGTTKVVKSEITYAEIPILIKYKSQRRKNFRMYLVAGPKPAFEVTNKKKSEDPKDELNLSKVNLSIDYGFGADIYYPMFKFSPEIRFSHGIVNMLAPSDSNFNKPLESLRTHSVSLFLIFGS